MRRLISRALIAAGLLAGVALAPSVAVPGTSAHERAMPATAVWLERIPLPWPWDAGLLRRAAVRLLCC
jgi:hypothetical protein